MSREYQVNKEVTTGKVRLSYHSLLEPTSFEDKGDKKYYAVFIFDERDQNTIDLVKEAIIAAYKEIRNPKKDWWNPLRDGDEREGDTAYAGKLYVKATSYRKPQIFDENFEEVTNMDEFYLYGGCYVRADIEFFSWNKGARCGVSCALNGIQKIADGEMFTGRKSRNPFKDAPFLDY